MPEEPTEARHRSFCSSDVAFQEAELNSAKRKREEAELNPASEHAGSKRPLEKAASSEQAEAAQGAPCVDDRARLREKLAQRKLSQAGAPPPESTTDRGAGARKESREKKQQARQALALLREKEREKEQQARQALALLRGKAREKEQQARQALVDLRDFEREEKAKQLQAKLRSLEKEAREEKAKQKADAQADAQAMASKVKATLEEPGMMHECFDSIASCPYDLERGKVGCS